MVTFQNVVYSKLFNRLNFEQLVTSEALPVALFQHLGLFCHAGWLLKRPVNLQETIYDTFKSIWVDAYRYIIQDLNPKMDVSTSQKFGHNLR